MKPFLGIDITDDRKNERFNCDELKTASPSDSSAKRLEESSLEAVETLEKSGLPTFVTVFAYLCGIASAILTAGILRSGADEELTFRQQYAAAPWMFWLAGTGFLIFVLLIVFDRRKMNSILESDESKITFSKLDGACESVYRELGVPADAKTVDLLSFSYKTKNGEAKARTTGLKSVPYTALEFKLFADDGRLCFADRDGKYEIPVSSIGDIKRIDKRIGVCGWNKDVLPKEGEYKKYKINDDGFPCLYYKPYYIMEFKHNGEQWGVYIPCYEIEVFESVLKKHGNR